MKRSGRPYDARAHAKRASRSADTRSVASGRKSPEALKRDNEILVSPKARVRIDLPASRSLS
jgi:hypothetical protein